jgi:hypothetical protein
MKVALGIYLVIGAVNIVLGAIYFTSEQFMSYHSEAVGMPWREVDPGTRTLILALMKVAGGGWITVGFFTIILALGELIKRSAVSRWALPTGTLIFYLASLAATWGVHQATGAATPWVPSLAVIGFALLAFVVDAPWSSRGRDSK